MATKFGYFLIADISGYTQYLSASELDHAQKTLTALLNLLISHTRPPLIISRLAGDAVISYALKDNFLLGQTFVEMLEDTYVSFRRAIEMMVRNTTCPCNACRNIGSLDLKFFVHYGEFGVQRLDAHDELVGSDVNLLHRLLKNSVKEATGFAAYTLYTQAAISALGLDGSLAGLVAHEEAYEHLGTVQTFVEDMHPVWEAKKGEAQVLIAPADRLMRLEVDIAAPREFVWEALSRPDFASVLLGGARIEIEKRRRGQIAEGSLYQCYHGDALVSNLIIDWQPFERVVFQYGLPMPIAGVTGLVEARLEPTAKGTRLVETYSKCRGPIAGRVMGDIGLRSRGKGFEQQMAAFRDAVERDCGPRRMMADVAVSLSSEEIAASAREALLPA